jgi:hypothetical protein
LRQIVVAVASVHYRDVVIVEFIIVFNFRAPHAHASVML